MKRSPPGSDLECLPSITCTAFKRVGGRSLRFAQLDQPPAKGLEATLTCSYGATQHRRLRRPAPLEEKARQCPLHSWRCCRLSSLQTNAECLARPVPPHGGPASLPRGTCLCRACVALLLLGGAWETSLAGRRHCSSPSPLAWGRGDGNLLCTLIGHRHFSVAKYLSCGWWQARCGGFKNHSGPMLPTMVSRAESCEDELVIALDYCAWEFINLVSRYVAYLFSRKTRRLHLEIKGKACNHLLR